MYQNAYCIWQWIDSNITDQELWDHFRTSTPLLAVLYYEPDHSQFFDKFWCYWSGELGSYGEYYSGLSNNGSYEEI